MTERCASAKQLLSTDLTQAVLEIVEEQQHSPGEAWQCLVSGHSGGSNLTGHGRLGQHNWGHNIPQYYWGSKNSTTNHIVIQD